jgi:hypothetical protein
MTMTSPTGLPLAAAPRRRRPSRRWVLVAVLALVVVTSVVGWLVVRKSAVLDGPVGNNDVFSSSGLVPFGKLAATAAPTAYNGGDETAVLERIELVNQPPEIDVVKTYIAGPGRGVTPAMTDWPDRDFNRDLHPVNGYRLAPVETEAGRVGVALAFVMRADKPGRHAVKAVDVTYHIGGTRYKARIRNGFAVCSYTGPRPRGTCRAPRDL